MAFRFKDKERPRGYTSKVAGLLHVRLPRLCVAVQIERLRLSHFLLCVRCSTTL